MSATELDTLAPREASIWLIEIAVALSPVAISRGTFSAR